MNRAFKAMLVMLAAVCLWAGPAAADGVSGSVPSYGPDPTDPSYFYDREGTRYHCDDLDPDLGCMYDVEDLGGGAYYIYWVGWDGIRYRVVVNPPPNSGCGGE